jgi:hypothetical protein
MDAIDSPPPLADQLGPPAAAGLVQVLGTFEERTVNAAVERVVERFERRLVEETSALRVESAALGSSLRQEMAALARDLRQEMAGLRTDMARQQVELLRWSFLFWIGQVIAIATLLGVLR